MAAALDQSRRAELGPWADRFYRAAGIDFVVVLDRGGAAIYRARNPHQHGASLASNPLIAESMRQGKAVSGSLLLSADDLRNEGSDLVEQARFAVPPAPATRPAEQQPPSAGMVVAVAVPILDEHGQTVGVLYGGEFLNGRNELVDSIKQEVFSAETYEGKPIGTVTVFQGDLRIATNVIGPDGRRAVGTRMSEAVSEEVLQNGQTWRRRRLSSMIGTLPPTSRSATPADKSSARCTWGCSRHRLLTHGRASFSAFCS